MPEMTARERFLTALNVCQPDRVPLFEFLFSRNVYLHVIGHEPATYNAEDAVACSLRLGLDGVFIPFGGYSGLEADFIAENTYVDEWGSTYRIDRSASWPIDAPIAHPVKDAEDWRNYRLPDVHVPGRADGVATAKQLCPNGELAVVGGAQGPFTTAWFILGLENFSIKMYEDPDLIKRVIHAAADWYIEAGRLMAEAGADVLVLAEDLGGVSGPLMSLRQLREFVLPEFRRMAKAFRGFGVPVLMHNDGNIRLYLDDLAETDINGYHPIERNAGMDLAEVKAKYGKRLCLVGNVNNKTTLVFGTPEDVEAEVKECIRVAGPGGGYILASDHSVHDDIPMENVYAMLETGKRWGKYPIAL